MTTKNVLALVTSASQARIRGIARYAKSAGWNLMLENQLAHGPKGWNGDGVLVTMKDSPAVIGYIDRIRRIGIPVVNLTGSFVPDGIPAVIGDNAKMGALAAEHFADRAFRHVAWFSTNWNRIQQQRAAAFAGEWRRLRPTADAPLRFVWSENSSARNRDDWFQQSKWLAKLLKSAPKPLGMFCYSDYDASHVLGICRDSRIDVPREIAILGVDNNTVICENQSIPLSSVNHNLERVGYAGAALLDRLMRSGGKGDRGTGRRKTRNDAIILIPPQGIITRRSTETTAIADPLLRLAMVIIERKLAKPLGAAQIADEMGIARVRLDRLFARELGTSVGREILHQRMIIAKALLRDTEMTLSEIASRTGFCNAGYLANTFRREFNVTPGSYRASVRAKDQARLVTGGRCR